MIAGGVIGITIGCICALVCIFLAGRLYKVYLIRRQLEAKVYADGGQPNIYISKTNDIKMTHSLPSDDLVLVNETRDNVEMVAVESRRNIDSPRNDSSINSDVIDDDGDNEYMYAPDDRERGLQKYVTDSQPMPENALSTYYSSQRVVAVISEIAASIAAATMQTAAGPALEEEEEERKKNIVAGVKEQEEEFDYTSSRCDYSADFEDAVSREGGISCCSRKEEIEEKEEKEESIHFSLARPTQVVPLPLTVEFPIQSRPRTPETQSETEAALAARVVVVSPPTPAALLEPSPTPSSPPRPVTSPPVTPPPVTPPPVTPPPVTAAATVDIPEHTKAPNMLIMIPKTVSKFMQLLKKKFRINENEVENGNDVARQKLLLLADQRRFELEEQRKIQEAEEAEAQRVESLKFKAKGYSFNSLTAGLHRHDYSRSAADSKAMGIEAPSKKAKKGPKFAKHEEAKHWEGTDGELEVYNVPENFAESYNGVFYRGIETRGTWWGHLRAIEEMGITLAQTSLNCNTTFIDPLNNTLSAGRSNGHSASAINEIETLFGPPVHKHRRPSSSPHERMYSIRKRSVSPSSGTRDRASSANVSRSIYTAAKRTAAAVDALYDLSESPFSPNQNNNTGGTGISSDVYGDKDNMTKMRHAISGKYLDRGQKYKDNRFNIGSQAIYRSLMLKKYGDVDAEARENLRQQQLQEIRLVEVRRQRALEQEQRRLQAEEKEKEERAEKEKKSNLLLMMAPLSSESTVEHRQHNIVEASDAFIEQRRISTIMTSADNNRHENENSTSSLGTSLSASLYSSAANTPKHGRTPKFEMSVEQQQREQQQMIDRMHRTGSLAAMALDTRVANTASAASGVAFVAAGGGAELEQAESGGRDESDRQAQNEAAVEGAPATAEADMKLGLQSSGHHHNHHHHHHHLHHGHNARRMTITVGRTLNAFRPWSAPSETQLQKRRESIVTTVAAATSDTSAATTTATTATNTATTAVVPTRATLLIVPQRTSPFKNIHSLPSSPTSTTVTHSLPPTQEERAMPAAAPPPYSASAIEIPPTSPSVGIYNSAERVAVNNLQNHNIFEKSSLAGESVATLGRGSTGTEEIDSAALVVVVAQTKAAAAEAVIGGDDVRAEYNPKRSSVQSDFPRKTSSSHSNSSHSNSETIKRPATAASHTRTLSSIRSPKKHIRPTSAIVPPSAHSSIGLPKEIRCTQEIISDKNARPQFSFTHTGTNSVGDRASAVLRPSTAGNASFPSVINVPVGIEVCGRASSATKASSYRPLSGSTKREKLVIVRSKKRPLSAAVPTPPMQAFAAGAESNDLANPTAADRDATY